MESVRILHMADLHIGRKFKSLSPNQAVIRQAEVLATLEDTLSRFDDADLVLISGDLFEENADDRYVDFVAKLFNRHDNKRFFVSCGNHDCCESVAIKHFAKKVKNNVHVFSDSIEKIKLDDLKVDVYGISFAAPGSYTSLISNFSCENSEYTKVMVMHGDVCTVSSYNPVTISEIARSGLDYLALGHIHKFSGFLKSGGVTYAYPGVLEPGGFDETGDCGVIYGTISEKEISLDFFPVSKRKYLLTKLDISNLTSDDELISALRKIINPNDFYRVCLEGFSTSFVPDCELCKSVVDSFYLEIECNTVNSENILDYVGEESFKGKIASSLLQLKSSYQKDIFDQACEVLTKLVCKG